MSEYLNEINDATETIEGVGLWLQSLSANFEAVGNHTLSGQLYQASADLFVASERVNKAAAKDIIEQAKAAEQNAASLVAVALTNSMVKEGR